ncbi:MAG: thiol reductant ABC exporter subunit CydC [Actinobacteria bacterium]|nr:thiol reductant ABC exporter subunit CydC [Actinomycetota bacterium]
MRRLLSLWRGDRWRLAAAVATGTGTVAAGAGLLATGAYLILRAGLHPPILDLTVAIVGVRFFGIARAALRYLERLVAHGAALRLTARLRTDAFSHVERLSPGGLETDRAGELLAGIADDLEDLQESMVRSLLPAAVTAAVSLLAGLIAGLMLPSAGAVLAAALAVTAGAAGIVAARWGRWAATRLGPARAGLAGAVVDLVEGAAEAVAFGRAPGLLERAADADAALRRLSRRAAWASGLGSALVALGSGLALWLVLRVAVAASSAGALDPLLVGVLALLAIAAFEPAATLPSGLDRLGPGVAAAGRLDALAARPDPVPEPDGRGPDHLEPALVLRGAWIRHRAGADHAVRDLDLDLRPGRTVALVGESGAGKSSVAAGLLRFRDLARGTYTVGGVDAGEIPAARVRRVVGAAAEDAHLLAASVRANLAIADPDAGDDDLVAALAEVHLGDWLAGLPDGLDTPIGPGGRPVSGGERRRISLARALLARFPILIADEPTAGLDPATAAAVVDEVLSTGRGVLLITHGTEGLDRVDEIVVLDQGRVAERGTHRQLLAAGGRYARLRGA